MNITPEMIFEMQKSLRPSDDEIRKLLSTTFEPFSEIPYDKFQKFSYTNKNDLMNYVVNYISQKGSPRSKTCKTVAGKEGVQVYGLMGYKWGNESSSDASFFIMYYFRNAYSACSGTWVDCLELYSVVVPDSLRRQGIAKSIIIELENLALVKQIKEIHIKAVTSPIMASMIKNMRYHPNGNIMNYCKVLI